MKLMANFFQGKKPSLEEGPIIYTVNDEDTASNVAVRNKGCKPCLKFMKWTFFVSLAVFLLFLVWIGFIFPLARQTLGESRGMCGVIFDYIDRDNDFNDFNTTEANDMNFDGSDPIRNYEVQFIESESSTDINDDTTASVKSLTYEEALDYMRRAMQQVDAAED